jgi:putative alpha-1,2-mannosidase
LYHNHAAPTNYTEECTNGEACYIGMDNNIHKLSNGVGYFSDLSIWDVYRTQMPYFALTSPKMMSQIAQSLVNMYIEGKEGKEGRGEVINF